MSTTHDFGFELLNRLYGEQVTKKEDVLILFLHWYLIKNGFKCIGLGDSRTVNPEEVGSELLPEQWNQDSSYKFRYLKENKLYIVLGVKSDADLLISFMKVDGISSSSIMLSPETIVKELHGTLETLIPNYPETLHKIKTELLDPVYNGVSKTMSTQTSSSVRNRPDDDSGDPLRVPTVRPVYRDDPRFVPHRPEIGVGRDDLDPLGVMGGRGMIFDPLGGRRINPAGSLPGIPPGAVPPGARFDPFEPPRERFPAPRRNPDSDHFPPPGYDDMFM